MGAGSPELKRVASGDRCESHGLLFDGLVVDLKQFGLVENEFLSSHTSDFVERGQFNGITRACFFAHAAVDATKLIDVKLLGILFPVVPR